MKLKIISVKNLFAKDEFNLLGAFYIERFISHLIYFAPAFWIIFFNENLSLTQVSILFAVLAISTFIFEIPTGAFADLFGRKASTLFSYILLGILLPLFMFVENFYILLLMFVLWGLFGTFYSGAREAWTVDNLKYYKREDLIQSYYLKEYSIIRVGMFLSGFLGAFIVAKLGIASIWIFAGLSWFISFFLLLPVKEHKLSKEQKTSFKKLQKQAKTAISYSLKHKILLFILLATFFIVFRDSFGGMIVWQPFLKELGFPIFALGFLFSASMILGSIAPFVAKPILRICKTEKNYFIVLLIFSLLLNIGVLFVNNFVIGVVFMLTFLFLIDLFVPVNDSFTQGFIPSKTRATVLSFKSMIIALAYAVSLPITGFFADKIGIQNTIVLGGLFLIPAIYFYFKINPKGKIASLEKYTFKKYSSKFPELFRREKSKLKKILPKNAEIKHIGSTAVVGLGGKGIIDIFISVNKKEIKKTKENLEKHGYRFKPTGGSKQRKFFEKDYKHKGKIRRVHIHLTYHNSKEFKNAVNFVKYLKDNPKMAKEYAKIKKQATELAKGNAKIYQKHKKDFLEKLNKRKV